MVAALHQGLELQPVPPRLLDLHADVAGAFARHRDLVRGGVDLEGRVRVTSVLLRRIHLVREPLLAQEVVYLPRPPADRAVYLPRVPVLAEAAAARRTAAADLYLRLVGERAYDVSDVPGGEPSRRGRLLRRLLAVLHVVSAGDAGQRLRLLRTRYLYEVGLRRQVPEQPDEVVLVLRQLEDVVGGDDVGSFVGDGPQQLPVADDIVLQALVSRGDVETYECVALAVASRAAAVYVDSEERLVDRLGRASQLERCTTSTV